MEFPNPIFSLAKNVQIAKKEFPQLILSVNLSELCEKKIPLTETTEAHRGEVPIWKTFFHGMENGRRSYGRAVTSCSVPLGYSLFDIKDSNSMK